MTTTVTVKTHGWPVDVTITDRYARSIHTDVITVEPNCEREFYVTDNRTLQFAELPLPQTDEGVGG